jgi:hypothetical protein
MNMTLACFAAQLLAPWKRASPAKIMPPVAMPEEAPETTQLRAIQI